MQSTLAVVSLKNIQSNLLAIRRIARAPVIAVVKDDAYGHGAVAVAEALADMAAMFAVSTVEEGARLVHAGIRKDVLVLTPPLTREEGMRARALGLVLTLSSFPVLRVLRHAGRGVRAHLAVNTGMNRYGFSPSEVERALDLASSGGIAVEGVFSHLYLPEDGAARAAQEAAFRRACATVRARFPFAMRHLAASGGIACGADALDGVRAGLSLYGYLPEGVRAPVRLHPAMKVYAAVSHCGTLYGGGVGYAAAARAYPSLYTLRAGYGDGFFRAGGIGAEGKLCMDACVCAGEKPFAGRVCVLSDAAAYARAHATSAYEVLVRIGKGAEKRYVR